MLDLRYLSTRLFTRNPTNKKKVRSLQGHASKPILISNFRSFKLFWKNSPTFCFADSRIRWEPHSAKWGGSRCRPQIYAFKLTYSLQKKRKFIFQPAIWGVTVSLREGNPNKTWQTTFKMPIGHFHQQLESSKLLKSKHKLKTFLEVSLQNQQEF